MKGVYSLLNFAQCYEVSMPGITFIQLGQKQMQIVTELDIGLNFCGALVCLSNCKREPFESIGFGFVKDVDLIQKKIYIISPVSLKQMECTSAIIKSPEIDFSKTFYLDQAEYFDYSAELLQDIQGDMEPDRSI